MRAALALLLALSTLALELDAAAAAALIVLRGACRARDPAAFGPAALESPTLETRPRVLSYEETCGPGWRTAMPRAALGALANGDALGVVGWPGAAVCGALEAAARTLIRAAPAVCALNAARARAVTLLAARLRWSSALLAPAAPHSECAAALREVARALLAAGVTLNAIGGASLVEAPSSVMISCASQERGVDEAVQLTSSGSVTSRTLLLHVDEPSAPAMGEDALPPERNYESRTAVPAARAARRSRETRSAGIELHRLAYLLALVDARLLRRDILLLSDERLDVTADLGRLYADALAETVRTATAEATGIEEVDLAFRLYERPHSDDPATSWEWIATVSTVSTRPLDRSTDCATEARLSNHTSALERWSEEAQWGPSAAVAIALGSGVAALALCVSALGALGMRRRAFLAKAVRRESAARGGRGIAAVLLSPGEFSFPADERRRVGEGMETMLSCWLRRLHEFGGPEPSHPELLEPQPRVPSLPSSTCSVNRVALDRLTRYKGDPVHVKYVQATGDLELKRKAIDVLLVLQNLRHENLNPFIGWLGAPGALVWAHCGRGSLEDVLMADEIKLDWTFRLSLLTDLVKGMRYLHASPLRVHGRLSSRNCVVDSRWVLRLTDYGQPAFRRAQPLPPHAAAARDLLWTAPELLRDESARARGSQPGDVFSFAIVMQEVIMRGEPYCMLSLTPEELVEKLSRPPPLIRPSVSIGAAPPEAVSVMRQCWSEAPEQRPDFHRLHDTFRRLHRGRKINIVDSMFEMLEKYSNNLEELIKERTEQLDMEKKKTEQLLNRMLPRSVAERLMLGGRVEPEEFADVSIYFSDIVGFTALAARSTPVQVVDLLNDLYTCFDAAIERYRVYKVETIGDAYMVVGGLPARAADHAESVATMALHLLHLAGRFRPRHLPDTPLRLRIGLHSGPVCAAVVGLTMPRYCLFGDTVNTASRMESTGAAWRVQCSAATARRLSAAGGFSLRYRGLVQVKGKGAMHTYWLLGKDGFDKPLPTPPPLPSEDVLFETDGENDSSASSPGAADEGSPRLSTAARRSGVVSADSSPPPPPRSTPRLYASTASVERYRRLGAGDARAGVRRQWSLERGDSLAEAAAAAAAAGSPLAPVARTEPSAPSALLLSGASTRPPRYRTRDEPHLS